MRAVPVFISVVSQRFDQDHSCARGRPVSPLPRRAISTMRQLGRYRKRPGAIHHEHDKRRQFGRAAVEDLHGHVRGMAVHGAAGFDVSLAIGSLLAQPPGDDIEGFRAGMRVCRCPGPGRSGAMVDT